MSVRPSVVLLVLPIIHVLELLHMEMLLRESFPVNSVEMTLAKGCRCLFSVTAVYILVFEIDTIFLLMLRHVTCGSAGPGLSGIRGQISNTLAQCRISCLSCFPSIAENLSPLTAPET